MFRESREPPKFNAASSRLRRAVIRLTFEARSRQTVREITHCPVGVGADAASYDFVRVVDRFNENQRLRRVDAGRNRFKVEALDV